MAEYEGAQRTRHGDVVIHRAVESVTDSGERVVDVYVGEPAAWSRPAFRVIRPPSRVMKSDGSWTDHEALGLAESVGSVGGVRIVRGRR